MIPMNTDKINKAKEDVAIKGGFDNWSSLESRTSWSDLQPYINEAILLYHKTELEEAGKELPSETKAKEFIQQGLGNAGMIGRADGINWMYSKASKIIAKMNEELEFLRIERKGSLSMIPNLMEEATELKAQLSKPKTDRCKTGFIKVSIKEHGLPTDGKPHYYILKDGGLADKPKYSIHKEQIQIIKQECEYWLEEVILPIQPVNGDKLTEDLIKMYEAKLVAKDRQHLFPIKPVKEVISIEQCKSDIACNRRYNWKSLIEYLIEQKSFDLIDKTVTEVCQLYHRNPQSVKGVGFSLEDVKRIFFDYSTYRNSEEMHNGGDPLEFEEWADKFLQAKEGNQEVANWDDILLKNGNYEIKSDLCKRLREDYYPAILKTKY